MLECTLLLVGVACLTYSGGAWLDAARYQREERATLDRILAASAPPGDHDQDPPAGTPIGPAGLIGQLEIPRLNLSAVVVEGDDEPTLGMAIGHLPDTPMPWEHGNSALAAHRDGFFRPLQDIRMDDEIVMSTVHGNHTYRVREMLIVDPGDVWVLDPTERSTLTLITCYPFSYVGRAPHRFVVRAEQVAPKPGATIALHSHWAVKLDTDSSGSQDPNNHGGP